MSTKSAGSLIFWYSSYSLRPWKCPSEWNEHAAEAYAKYDMAKYTRFPFISPTYQHMTSVVLHFLTQIWNFPGFMLSRICVLTTLSYFYPAEGKCFLLLFAKDTFLYLKASYSWLFFCVVFGYKIIKNNSIPQTFPWFFLYAKFIALRRPKSCIYNVLVLTLC